jgi:hypothetical protein
MFVVMLIDGLRPVSYEKNSTLKDSNSSSVERLCLHSEVIYLSVQRASGKPRLDYRAVQPPSITMVWPEISDAVGAGS